MPDALDAVNRLMRDHRTGELHPIDPRLLDLLVALHGRTEATACYELICGYRGAGNQRGHAPKKPAGGP